MELIAGVLHKRANVHCYAQLRKYRVRGLHWDTVNMGAGLKGRSGLNCFLPCTV